MLWTLQLTPWALPPLLALLVGTREMLFLWPRRREKVSQGLLVLGAIAVAWATLHLVAVVTPVLDVKVAMEVLQYLATCFIPVAWAAFVLVLVRRTRALYRWPMVALYAATAATLLAGLRPSLREQVMVDPFLHHEPSGMAGLVYGYGPWFWAQAALRVLVLVMATWLVADVMRRQGGARRRGVVPWVAAALALGPFLAHLAAGDGAQWIDPSPVGLSFATAALSWGLLRHRLLDLGPVARTLVMVELRDPIVVLDGKGRIVDSNRAAEEKLGLRPYADVPLTLGALWAASRSSEPRPERTLMPLPVHGAEDEGEAEERTFEVTLTSLGGRRGSGRTAVLFRDVTQRERAERNLVSTAAALRAANSELERLAHTDPLTGLGNRRLFMDVLARELERAHRYDRPLSVVLLDLDDFKSVNDLHGHALGDEVLQGTAAQLRSVSRDIDLPARIGGEELVLILPETDADGARAVGERLRERVARTRYSAPDGSDFRITASIGIASAGPQTWTAEALLRRADDALYRAKEEGKNRVEMDA